MTPLAYKQRFFKRIQMLRKKAGYTSVAKFAQELGIDQATCASYESRTFVPHHLLPLVCELLNCGPWMLLTGQSDQFAPPLENGDRPYHIAQPIRFVTVRATPIELATEKPEAAKADNGGAS